jgi:hypothetical protein
VFTNIHVTKTDKAIAARIKMGLVINISPNGLLKMALAFSYLLHRHRKDFRRSLVN